MTKKNFDHELSEEVRKMYDHDNTEINFDYDKEMHPISIEELEKEMRIIGLRRNGYNNRLYKISDSGYVFVYI